MPATCPYPEPHWSVHVLTTNFLKFHLNIIFHLHLGIPSGLFPSVFPTKPSKHLSSPHTCYMPPYLILLYLMPRTIFGQEYRSLSSSLCGCPHSSVTSSLLGLNILLGTLFSNTLSLCLSLSVMRTVLITLVHFVSAILERVLLQQAVPVLTAVMYRVKYGRCASLLGQNITVCTSALPVGQVDPSCSSVIMPGNGQLLRVTGFSAPISK